MYALEFPNDLIGMIIMRVTGGEFAARRLPINYYEVFIETAKKGGMEAVCKTNRFIEYIKTNPAVKQKLLEMDAEEFINIQTNLLSKFLEGANLPVMGITKKELDSIKMPSLVIPGNDNTHNSKSGINAYNMLGNSMLHQLPIEDVDVDLISWEDWSAYEDEIAEVMSEFINKNMK